MRNPLFSFFAVSVLLPSACAPPPSDSATDGSPRSRVETLSTVVSAADRILVVDPQNQPIKGAQVLIGRAPGSPFAGNLQITDSSGVVTRPAGWTTEQPVTIDARGFVRATFFARNPAAARFQLRREASTTPLQLRGKTTGFGQLIGNGVLDVSLVYPAIPRSQASSLELTQLIGTGVDQVSVYGETLELPSNLSVPDQTETYFAIIPVTLDKPTYRLAVAEPGIYRFAAVRAQFDFKKTIDDLRAGKSFFDLINRLQFLSFSTRDFKIDLTNQAADLPLGENLLKAAMPVQAANVPAGYAMVATALVENNGLCVVTDVKRLLNLEMRTLMSSSKGNPLLVRTLKKFESNRTDFSAPDFEEMSSIISGANFKTSDFLPILKPIISRARSLVFSPPQLPAGLAAGVTQVTLSRVQIIGSGGLWLASKVPVWDFYAQGFAAEIELPALGAEVWAAKGRYRWELRYGAKPAPKTTPNSGPNTTPVDLSVNSLLPMTHIAKTAVDFTVP